MSSNIKCVFVLVKKVRALTFFGSFIVGQIVLKYALCWINFELMISVSLEKKHASNK